MKSGPHLFLPLLLGLPLLQAQEPPDELRPIQGRAVLGKLLSADDAGNLRVLVEGSTEPRVVQLASLRTIRLARGSRGGDTAPGLVILRTGVTLPATVQSCDGGNVRFSSPLLARPVVVPLQYVKAVRFAKAAEEDGGFASYAERPKDDNDLIYIQAGAKVLQRTVTIDRFADGKVYYEVRGVERYLEVARLYGLVMSGGAGVLPDPQPRPRVDVTFRDGRVVSGKLVGIDGEQCVMRLDEKVDLHVLRERVSEILVLSDRLVYLTDLTPIKVDQTPAFSRVWKWRKNESASGPGIRLGGRDYQNGLVLIPRTRLTYSTDGHYDYLEATIGIEDRSSGPAHAIFRVLHGDKVLYESKPLTRQSDPVDLKIEIRKVDRLTIEADFGKNYDFGDHCVFAEARLIKQGS